CSHRSSPIADWKWRCGACSVPSNEEPFPVRRRRVSHKQPSPDGTTFVRKPRSSSAPPCVGWSRRRSIGPFSNHSYGFRPSRSAHQAVAQAQKYIAAGYGWVVDFDLEKFFDRVQHDKLMGQIAKRVEDKRLLKLIRAFLNAGVMENGLVSPSVEG